jgi:DNA-directed RNA polymerase subunit H (RpoH/RPB5)
MFKYRNIKSEPNVEKFLSNYKFNSYHIETAEKNIIIFADVEYVSKVQDFRKLMKYIVDTKLNFKNFDNFIFISEEFMSSNVNKQMKVIFDEHIDSNNPPHVIETLKHDYFVAELPKGIYCSKHIILNEVETEIVLNEIMCKKSNLPRVSYNDPMIVWIGGRPGQVVKIESVSDVVGLSLTYRIIV